MTHDHKESIHGKYYCDGTSEERLTMAAIITQRFEFLRSHTKSITDMAIPYLYLSHLGGLAGGITYLTTKAANCTVFLIISIICFALGLLSVGVALLLMHKHSSKLRNEWNNDALLFYENKIIFRKMFENDRNRCKVDADYSYHLCIASFFLMIAGLALIGSTLYFNN